MESSSGELIVKHAIAKNLGRMTNIGMRFLEVSISSLNQRREDAIRRKKMGRGMESLDDVLSHHVMQPNFARMSMQQTKREDFALDQVTQALETLDEDYVGPNYDAEV